MRARYRYVPYGTNFEPVKGARPSEERRPQFLYENEIAADDNSQATGILTYGAGPGGDANNPTNCHAGTSYGTSLPSYLNLSNNHFEYKDGAAIVLSTYVATISSNYFLDNQLVNQVGGGVIVDSTCSAYETISANTMDDTDVAYPGNKAMELCGLNMTLENNTVSNFPGPGIYMNSTCGVAVFGGTIQNVNRFQSGVTNPPGEVQTGGLYLTNQSTPAARPIQEITVANFTSEYNYSGIAFLASTGTFSNVSVNNSASCTILRLPRWQSLDPRFPAA